MLEGSRQVAAGVKPTRTLPTGGRTRACGGLTGLGPLAEAGQEEQLKPQIQQLEAGLGTRIVQIATGWAHSSFVTGASNSLWQCNV